MLKILWSGLSTLGFLTLLAGIAQLFIVAGDQETWGEGGTGAFAGVELSAASYVTAGWWMVAIGLVVFVAFASLSSASD